MSDDPSAYPPPVRTFIEVLHRVPGVQDVDVGLTWVDGTSVDDLSLPGEFALLPHVALIRSGGGRTDEAVVCAKIEFERSSGGWIGLEFLAWWTRDNARSGNQVQLRPVAFLPQVGDSVQLGKRLSFYLEVFVTEPTGEPADAASQLVEYTESLDMALSIYAPTIETALQR